MASKTVLAQVPYRKNIASQSTAVNVLTTSTMIAQAANARGEITIVNDGANVVYIALNTTDGTTVPSATLGAGIRLNANGGSWSSNIYLGPVAAIAATGATNVTVAEI